MNDKVPVQSDLFERVTQEIIKAIEEGVGTFTMPWHGTTRPYNAYSGEPYHGVNALVLWSSGRNRHYRSFFWATAGQWRMLGATVRAGETAVPVVYYQSVPSEADGLPDDELQLMGRIFQVFNADQVEGWKPPDRHLAAMVLAQTDIDAFVSSTGADIRRGHTATYMRAGDYITVPSVTRFVATDSSPALENYYATLFHELIYWTGHWSRLSRDLSGRFGSMDYAMEEVVAELGAAFLCSEFFVLSSPRKDHAKYVASWLKVLRSDSRAIFSAAVAANRAVEFLKAS